MAKSELNTGILGNIRKRLFGAPQSRSTSSAKLAALINFMDRGGKASLGNHYEQNITVFRCVNQIATTLAQVPLNLYRGEDLVTSGPVFDLLKHPNPLMGRTKFVHTIVAQELLHGASYVYVDADDSNGVPRALLPLLPRDVSPIRNSDNLYDLRGWQLGGPSTSDGKSLVVPPERVARFEYAISDHDPLLPVSPLEVARMAVETDHLSAVWNKAMLENSGAPAGILKWVGEGRIDEKDAGLIRDQWLNSYGGAENAESIAVLGSNFDFQQIGQGVKDMQLSEGRRWNLAEIARAFNVPTLYLNEYSATGLSDAGLKVQERLFYHNTVQPIAAVFVEVMNRMVVSPIEDDLKLVWEWASVDALREDYGGKLKHADQLWRLGYPINIINEKLELGMPDVPWGDEAFVQAQMITAETAIEQSGMLGDAEATDPKPGEEEVEEEAPRLLSSAVDRGALLHQKNVVKSAQVSTENTTHSYTFPKREYSSVESCLENIPRSEVGDDYRIDEETDQYRVRYFDTQDFKSDTLRVAELVAEDGRSVRRFYGTIESQETDDSEDGRGNRREVSGGEGAGGEAQAEDSEVVEEVRALLAPLRKSLLGRMRRNLMAQRSRVLRALDSGGVIAAMEAFDRESFGAVFGTPLCQAAGHGVSSGNGSCVAAGVVDVDDLGEASGDLATWSLGYAEVHSDRVQHIADRVAERVAAAIQTAHEDGRDAEGVAAVVRDAFNALVAPTRCKLIANTEVHTAFHGGRFLAMEAQGVERHRWVAHPECGAGGKEVHPRDGEQVEIGGRFSKASNVRFPGDPEGAPAAIVGCMCATVPS